jgi:hypothetical protein
MNSNNRNHPEFLETAGAVAPRKGFVVTFYVGQAGGFYFGGFPFFEITKVGGNVKFFLCSQNQVNSFNVSHFIGF